MKTIILILAIAIYSPLLAQTAQEAADLIENEQGFGIKAAGMGNAFTGLADDYSAIYWNPAGLAQLESGQIYGSLSHFGFKNSATYLNTLSSDERSFTKFQSFGVAYPFPVVRGAFVLAFGYQKVNNTDGFADFNGENQFFDDSLQINVPYQEEFRTTSDGEMENWSFAVAMDLSKNFSAGITLNFIGGTREYTYNYTDYDDTDFYSYTYFDTSSSVINDYSGINIKLGGLFRLSENLRLGSTITFPTSITVDEEWSVEYYDAYDDLNDSYGDDSGTFDYIISVPFKFSFGLSYSHPLVTLSSSVDYVDWSQLEYDVPSNRNSSEYFFIREENTILRENYRPVLSYAVGGDLNVLNSGLHIRGGYQFKPSPLKNADSDFDKSYYSFGLGYTVDKRTSIDFSYTYGSWKKVNEYESLYEFITNEEDIETQRFLFGLKYHF